MSKVLSTNENYLRYSNVTDTKPFFGKSTKETKPIDFKSPLKPSLGSNNIKSTYNSPVQHPSKTGYAWVHLKSPNEKSNPTMASIENFEIKENYSFETKEYSTSKKEVKKGFNTQNTDKSLTMIATAVSVTGKPGSSQAKTHKSKPSLHIHEPSSSQKPKKNETGSQNSINVSQKDNKPTIMKEPAKKASLPTNLKLTLEKICTKEGSYSHRVQLNSPTSESSKVWGVPSQQKKSGRAPGTESKSKSRKDEKNGNNNKDSNAKSKLNTMLVGLVKPTYNEKKKVTKLSMRDASSVSVTPRQDEVYSIEEDDTAKKYQKLLGMLKEKNKVIKQLSQDKSELRSTLDSMGEELKSLQKVKALVKERGKSLVDLQGDLNKLGIQYEEPKNQTHRNYEKSKFGGPAGIIPGMNFDPMTLRNYEVKDINKNYTKTSLRQQEQKKGISERAEKNWINIMDQNQKESNLDHSSSEFFQAGGGSSTSEIHIETLSVKGRNASVTPEKTLRARGNSLDENEKLSYLRDIDEDFEIHQNIGKKQSTKANAPMHMSVQSSHLGETLRTGHIDNRNKDRDFTSVDDSTIRRRFSHDVDMNMQFRARGLDSKGLEQFTLGISKQGRSGSLDIGKALNQLKGRLEKILQKRPKKEKAKTYLVGHRNQNGDFYD